MIISSKSGLIAIGLAGAMAVVTPSFAAPVLSSTASVKAAVPNGVVDVQWRRWHHGGRGGAIAGLEIGRAHV